MFDLWLHVFNHNRVWAAIMFELDHRSGWPLGPGRGATMHSRKIAGQVLLPAAIFFGQLVLAGAAFAQSWSLTLAPTADWTAIAGSADGTRLVATANNGTGSIYTSMDGGITWSNANAPAQSWVGVASSADGMKLVAVGNTYPGAICISTNGGMTWSNAIVPAAKWAGVACSSNGAEVVAVANGPIYVSGDSGGTWHLTDAPSEAWTSAAASADGTRWVAAGNNSPAGPVYVSTNSGFNWLQTSAPSDEWESAASSADGGILGVVGNNYPTGPVCVSTNYGSAWPLSGATPDNYFVIACSAGGTRIVAASQYINNTRGIIYLSRDCGQTWQNMNAPPAVWSGLTSSADGSRLAAVVNGGGIYTWQTTPFKLNTINVLCSRNTFASTFTNAAGTNNGLIPYTYVPDMEYLSAATNANYDAADTNETGTAWNVLLCPVTTVTNMSGSNLTTLFEQAIPLKDSQRNPTPVTLNVNFTEGTGKVDTIRNAGLTTATNAPPANPAALMGQSWANNNLTEFVTFTLSGLFAHATYDLYLYGAGQANGYGGTYTLAPANQPPGYVPVSTEPDLNTNFHSVFDSTGTNPAPVLGLSWNLLPAVADNNGSLSFTVNTDSSTGVRGSINGFQLALVAGSVPPLITSLGLAGTNVLISATNGIAGQSYVVLTSTNLTQPAWAAVATNQLSNTGAFNLVVTNAENPPMGQQFYRLQSR